MPLYELPVDKIVRDVRKWVWVLNNLCLNFIFFSFMHWDTFLQWRYDKFNANAAFSIFYMAYNQTRPESIAGSLLGEREQLFTMRLTESCKTRWRPSWLFNGPNLSIQICPYIEFSTRTWRLTNFLLDRPFDGPPLKDMMEFPFSAQSLAFLLPFSHPHTHILQISNNRQHNLQKPYS